MKKTNKGFSLVELIIVIAIMAILAGALAPALIKYINKSRASAAISNGQQIATAIQTALSNEQVFDSASDVAASTNYSTWIAGSTALAQEVKKTIGSSANHKANKTMLGTSCDKNYYIEVHPIPSGDQDMVRVYVGKASDAEYMVYPTTGKQWKEQ